MIVDRNSVNVKGNVASRFQIWTEVSCRRLPPRLTSATRLCSCVRFGYELPTRSEGDRWEVTFTTSSRLRLGGRSFATANASVGMFRAKRRWRRLGVRRKGSSRRSRHSDQRAGTASARNWRNRKLRIVAGAVARRCKVANGLSVRYRRPLGRAKRRARASGWVLHRKGKSRL